MTALENLIPRPLVVARTADDTDVYVVLEVGDFLGLGDHLVAVPFTSIELVNTTTGWSWRARRGKR